MGERTPFRSAVAAAVAAAALATPAAAGAGPGALREHVSDVWSTTRPGAPAGRAYSVDFVNPADPSGKPPSVSHVHLQLPRGARFDTDAIAQCHATDAQLIVEGPAACPPASALGTMALTFDTGFPGSSRYLQVHVSFFNEHDELIFLSQDDRTGLRTVSRATVTTSSLDADIPPLPGTPPDGAADEQERATFLAASTSRGNYLTTPPRCPRTRTWVEHETYTFRDGVTQTVPVGVPCTRRRP